MKFKKWMNWVFAPMLLLVLWGCGASSGVVSGIEPTKTLSLDDGYEISVSAEKGDVLALDMRLPASGGYRVVGAAFDPAMFTLLNYQEYSEDGHARTRYLFKVLENGTSDILVKMRSGDGPVEVYKRITINVAEPAGFFSEWKNPRKTGEDA
ncbi:MAG: hypothetical protein V3571_15980 [Pseudodesulfovibrio sp.]